MTTVNFQQEQWRTVRQSEVANWPLVLQNTTMNTSTAPVFTGSNNGAYAIIPPIRLSDFVAGIKFTDCQPIKFRRKLWAGGYVKIVFWKYTGDLEEVESSSDIQKHSVTDEIGLFIVIFPTSWLH